MSCTYKQYKQDGYGTDWKTSCRKTVRMAGPIDVGMGFDPLPTEVYTFCPHCGERIVLDKGEKK